MIRAWDDLLTWLVLHPLPRWVWPALVALGFLIGAVTAGWTGVGQAGQGAAFGAVVGLVIAQFALGVLNVLLATPLETQVLHLAMANAIWIGYLLFSASLLGEPARSPTPISAQS